MVLNNCIIFADGFDNPCYRLHFSQSSQRFQSNDKRYLSSTWFGFCGFRKHFCRNENFAINVYFCLKGPDHYIKKEILAIYYFGFRCMVWHCSNCNWPYTCILDGRRNAAGIRPICVTGNWVYQNNCSINSTVFILLF